MTVAPMRSLDAIEKDWLRKKTPKFDVGDTAEVHVKIIEGDRERIQIFTGVIIAKRHQGLSETFTVRRIVQGEGVERVFPVHSPRVADIIVKKKGKVRRAKLHFLRERTGRATRVEEKLGALQKEQAAAREEAAAEKAKAAAAAPAPAPAPAKEEKPKAEKAVTAEKPAK
jgi:large subunit ribosomal protein L19